MVTSCHIEGGLRCTEPRGQRLTAPLATPLTAGLAADVAGGDATAGQGSVPKRRPGVVELENEMRMRRDESMC